MGRRDPRVRTRIRFDAIVLLVGQADLIRRLSAQELSTAQVATAVVALNTALSAEAAFNITLRPEFGPALLAAYFESYTAGFAASMLVGATLCLTAAALAWFVLRPSTSEAP